MSKPKYTVLTYIFNNYEIVQEVLEKDPEAEYILVTDDPKLKSNTWTIIYDASIANLPTFEKCYHVRYHPFLYANTDIVIRIDGDIEIRKSLAGIIKEFNVHNYDRCLMIHPSRNTFKSELAIWVKVRGYSQEAMDRQLELMQQMGYALNYKGLFECSFEIVRNNSVNADINKLIYLLLKYLGRGTIERMDQCIFSFVINHFFKNKVHVLPVSETIITNGELMQWYRHHSKDPSRSVVSTKPFMFNEPCKPWND